mgnify:FL=1
MDKNLQIVLSNLEPEIDKKCFELKQKTREKRMQKLFILAIVLLLFMPSTLIILNINVWGFIVGGISVIALAILIMLPIALKENARGECYE